MVYKPKVLDLFCGIGGLSFGLTRAGLEPIGGVDNWEDAARTFEHNHAPLRCLIADISKLQVSDLIDFFGVLPEDVDVVVGGPPCQGFSTVGKRDSRDPRNRLWKHYLELVAQIRPAYVVVENVEVLVVMDGGNVCEQIVANFARIGYRAKWRLLRSADFGVPQLRKRVIFMASLAGLAEPSFPVPTIDEHVTVADAIGDLPSLHAGELAARYSSAPPTAFQRAARRPSRVLQNQQPTNHPPRRG